MKTTIFATLLVSVFSLSGFATEIISLIPNNPAKCASEADVKLHETSTGLMAINNGSLIDLGERLEFKATIAFYDCIRTAKGDYGFTFSNDHMKSTYDTYSLDQGRMISVEREHLTKDIKVTDMRSGILGTTSVNPDANEQIIYVSIPKNRLYRRTGSVGYELEISLLATTSYSSLFYNIDRKRENLGNFYLLFEL